MGVICPHQHESQVGYIFTAFEPMNIFEYIVSVIGFTLVHFLKEFQFNCATLFPIISGREAEPDINPAAFRSNERLFQFD